MSYWKTFGFGLVAACLLGVTTGSAQVQKCVNLGCAAEWSGGSLTILEPSGLISVAHDINDAGQVVGWTGLYNTFPTEWSGGNVIILSSGGQGGGIADGINDAGQAVGYIYSPSAGPSFATKFVGDGVIILGGQGTVATSINDIGQVVGDTGFHATEWSGGSEINLADLPGSLGSEALSINDRGQVVGYSQVGRFDYATEWSHGRVIDLGPGIAYGINDRGQVVGESTVDGREYAVEWSGGSEIKLGPGIAFGINDAGQVVGESLGPPPAPAPEASSWAMMLLGFAGLGYAGYRRAKRAGFQPL